MKPVAVRPPLPSGDPDKENNVINVAFLAEGSVSNALKIDPVALCADGLASAASSYEKHGDLDMAAFSYHLAYTIRESHSGEDAAPTVEARRNLGDVYQTALAMADDVTAKTISPA